MQKQVALSLLLLALCIAGASCIQVFDQGNERSFQWTPTLNGCPLIDAWYMREYPVYEWWWWYYWYYDAFDCILGWNFVISDTYAYSVPVGSSSNIQLVTPDGVITYASSPYTQYLNSGFFGIEGPVIDQSQSTVFDLNTYYKLTEYADGVIVSYFSIENTGSTALDLTIESGPWNLGSDSNTQVYATSSGDTVVDSSDSWAISFESFHYNDPSVMLIWRGPGGSATTSASLSFDNYQIIHTPPQMQPGDVFGVLTFIVICNGYDEQVNCLNMGNQIITDPSPYLTFLTGDELASIVNFGIGSFSGPRPYEYLLPESSELPLPGEVSICELVANACDRQACFEVCGNCIDDDGCTIEDYGENILFTCNNPSQSLSGIDVCSDYYYEYEPQPVYESSNASALIVSLVSVAALVAALI